jgi:3-deoxy-D-arabino-heptulosonate 7-phosphate (DAHP) synthase
VTKITREDFEAWRDNPITQFVMGHLKEKAQECEDVWKGLLSAPSFNGESLMVRQADLRARREALAQVAELELTDMIEEDEEQHVNTGS